MDNKTTIGCFFINVKYCKKIMDMNGFSKKITALLIAILMLASVSMSYVDAKLANARSSKEAEAIQNVYGAKYDSVIKLETSTMVTFKVNTKSGEVTEIDWKASAGVEISGVTIGGKYEASVMNGNKYTPEVSLAYFD